MAGCHRGRRTFTWDPEYSSLESEQVAHDLNLKWLNVASQVAHQTPGDRVNDTYTKGPPSSIQGLAAFQ